MLPGLIFAITAFAVAFLLLFKSNWSAHWKRLVQQTVTAGLINWLLAVGWVSFSGLPDPAVGQNALLENEFQWIFFSTIQSLAVTILVVATFP